MTYRGHIQRGVVVLDDATDLPDGTPVSVHTLEAVREPRAGTPQAVLKAAGTFPGDPAELQQLLDELRQDKWAEVDAERQHLP